MMPQFSQRSRALLDQCDPRIVQVMEEVIKTIDISVLTGHRDQATQDEAYRTGHSQLQYPQSKHNPMPSLAIDVAPYPIDWKDTGRFYLVAGFILGIAKSMGIEMRSGCDWDQDWQIKDNNFNDLIHFELT